MKKILLFVPLIVVIFSLSSCRVGTNTPNYADAPKTVDGVEQNSYEDNLSGLTSYFKDKGYVAGEPKKMSSALIGAKEGYRYEFKYENVRVRIELYEYDLDNLNNDAKQILQRVKEEGLITVQGTTVNGVVSDNGKYLMIYINDKDNEDTIQRKEEVIKDFKSYK